MKAFGSSLQSLIDALTPGQKANQGIRNEHTLLELEVAEFLDHQAKGLVMGEECYRIEHELQQKMQTLAEESGTPWPPTPPAEDAPREAPTRTAMDSGSPPRRTRSLEEEADIVGQDPLESMPLPPASSGSAKGADGFALETRVDHILFMGASPVDRPRVRLGVQVRSITESLTRARLRDRFNFLFQIAVTPHLFTRHLLDLPEVPRYVHFAGFGVEGDPELGSGLVLENEQGKATVVSHDALPDLFRLFEPVDCILLNASHSASAAQAMAQVIEYVVGIDGDWTDQAAIEFATGFYDALGAGRSIDEAVDFGRSAIRLAALPEADRLAALPFLLAKPG